MDLKDIISEQLGQIEETYNSVHELKEIANRVLLQVAKINAPLYKRSGEFTYIQGLFLNSVPLKERPVDTAEFVEKGNLYISFRKKKEGGESLGQYSSEMNHRIYTDKYIDIFYNEEEIAERVNDALTRDYYDDSSVYAIFYYAFISTLIHELQHAFDDFRSRGKAFKTPQAKEFIKKYYNKANGEEIPYSSLNQEQALDKLKTYLQLPHEIWARFAQTFKDLRFYNVDWDDDPNDPNHILVTVKMYPLKEIVNSIRYEMRDFNVIPEKNKQRIYKAISAYWHKAQENLPAYQAMKEKQFNQKSDSDADTVNEVLSKQVEIDYTNEKILVNGEPAGVIEISDRNNGYVILDKIVVYPEFREQGIGTAAMKKIIDRYRSEKKILTLTPDEVHGGNKNKLLRWYQSLGFVLNKGKKKDFQTMQLMYLPIS